MTIQTITNLYEHLCSMKDIIFPAKVAFAITRNKRLCLPIVEDCEKTVVQIVNKYPGTTYKDGAYIIASEYQEQANKDLEELLSTEVDVALTKIKFTDIEQLDVPLSVMEALYDMLEES